MMKLEHHPVQTSSTTLPSQGVAPTVLTPCSPADRPVFLLDLFCGTAGVAAQFQVLGGKALGVDHHLDRSRVKAASIPLDLTEKWVQNMIMAEIKSGSVDAIMMAPPCGTSSRARNIPVKKHLLKMGAPHPRPLRSDRFPDGLPHLRGISKLRVEQANLLYRFCAEVAWLADSCGALFQIENPLNSFMWSTKPFRPLCKSFFTSICDECEYGSPHRKSTALLGNFYSERLQKRCSGAHKHEPYSISLSSVSGEWSFSTSAAAEYPLPFCKALAAAFYDRLPGSSPPADGQPRDPRVLAQVQPRAGRGPMLIHEYKCKIWRSLPADAVAPKVLAPGCPSCLADIPPGSKLVDTVMGINEKGEKGQDVCYGVFFSPDEFISRSLSLKHPFDVASPIEDSNLRAISLLAVEGPAAVASRRAAALRHYTVRAAELRIQEKELHRRLEPEIEAVMKSKRLLLFKEMLQDASIEDPSLFDEMCNGFKLVGNLESSGQFLQKWKPATVGVDQLKMTAKWAQRAVVNSCRGVLEDREVAVAVWEKTMEQVASQKGWVKGPFTAEELTNRVGPHWIPARRFGVRQSGKIREVDDFSQYMINASTELHEKLDLESLDNICAAARFFMGAVDIHGSVRAPLSGGTELGMAHGFWKTHDFSTWLGDVLISKPPISSWQELLPIVGLQCWQFASRVREKSSSSKQWHSLSAPLPA